MDLLLVLLLAASVILIEVHCPVELPATPAGPQGGWQEYEEMNDDDA